MAENPEQGTVASAITIGVVKETAPGETRVGLIPDSVKHLVGKGLNVVVEKGAGMGSSIADEEYVAPGATIADTAADVYAKSDVVVRVQAPSEERGELAHLRRDQMLVSFLAPLVNHELNTKLAESGVTAMAVDAVPRITRAQSMDALSAMSNIAGYKAVLLAADHLPKLFPLLMTAAGTIRPARVLVLGAGVAGLQAIATARRLGAVVDAYDVRAVVKEQVESLGARFVEIDTGSDAEAAGGYAREATPEELRRQQEGLNEYIANADVVITTALVPGRPAPRMIPAEAVKRMRHGSVIVDLAAETGGNCELTTPGEIATEHGITIIGLLNLPSTLPVHASQMYGKVITNFLDLLVKDGQINLNFEDEVIAGMCITHGGEIVQEQTRKMMGLVERAKPEAPSGEQSGGESAPDEESAGQPEQTDESRRTAPGIASIDTDKLSGLGREDSIEIDEPLVGEDSVSPGFEAAVAEDVESPVGNELHATSMEEPSSSGDLPDKQDPIELGDVYTEAKDAEAAGIDDESLADVASDDSVVYVEEEKNDNE